MTVKVWNASTGALVHTFTGFSERVVGVRFSHDASHLVAVAANGDVKVWMTGMWMEHNSYNISEDAYSIDISDDLDYVAVGGETGIHVHGSMNITSYPAFNLEEGGAVLGIDFQPGSTKIAAGTENGKVTLWDIASLLSVSENDNTAFNIQIWPNPTQTVVNIGGIQAHENCSYRIYNTNGALVQQGNINRTQSTLNIEA
jgi:WD40 repeat protein